MVKNLPDKQETQVPSLDSEDALEKEMATTSCLENPMDRGAWGLQSIGSQRVGHELSTRS